MNINLSGNIVEQHFIVAKQSNSFRFEINPLDALINFIKNEKEPYEVYFIQTTNVTESVKNSINNKQENNASVA